MHFQVEFVRRAPETHQQIGDEGQGQAQEFTVQSNQAGQQEGVDDEN
jgi:hypothetical protein